MRPQNILNNLDSIILRSIEEQSFTEVCEKLRTSVSKMKEKVIWKDDTIDSIETEDSVRTKYVKYFIYFAEKRMQKLLEQQEITETKDKKRFIKTLQFKERLERRESLNLHYSQKYRDYIKKIELS